MRALIWLAAFCISTPALTQELPPSSPSSPRLGLVLGGGGARGFAHVGVLQVLEENRIPVHAISGTSMGAVVGSLYASGNDATRITEIARTIPWSTVFNDKIERNRMPFRRKRDERDVLVDYRISFDDKGLVLPQGVLRGQELFLTLAEYLAPARGTTNFQNLAIPFKAVATDIETGTPVVMENGDIVTAVFASMAVPGGLPPVLRDDKLLVDGAIVDNLPIEVGRSMGVDHVIVVNVSTPLQSRDKLQSFVAILSQIQSMLGRESEQRQLETLNDADVLIEPHQPDISTTSFNKAEEGIAAGRAAALAVVDKLRRYSLSPEAWQRYVAARDGKAPDRNPVVHFVKIENDSEIPDRVVDEMITTQAGQRLNAAAMTNDLQDVYALGAFRSVL